jgi:hypothetical protein
MKKSSSLYSVSTSDDEIAALQKVDTHFIVKEKLLYQLRDDFKVLDLVGKTFVDVGSGPSPKLSQLVISLGCAKYVALDRTNVLEKIAEFYSEMSDNPKRFLDKIELIPMEINGDSIRKLNLNTTSNNVVMHIQMLLMHVQDIDQRLKLISSILFKGDISIFTEPNWGTAFKYKKGILGQFRSAMNKFFKIAGINGNYGGSLFSEVCSIVSKRELSVSVSKIPIVLNEEEMGSPFYMELVAIATRAINNLTFVKFKNVPKKEVTKLIAMFSLIKEKLIELKPVSESPIFESVIVKWNKK